MSYSVFSPAGNRVGLIGDGEAPTRPPEAFTGWAFERGPESPRERYLRGEARPDSDVVRAQLTAQLEQQLLDGEVGVVADFLKEHEELDQESVKLVLLMGLFGDRGDRSPRIRKGMALISRVVSDGVHEIPDAIVTLVAREAVHLQALVNTRREYRDELSGHQRVKLDARLQTSDSSEFAMLLFKMAEQGYDVPVFERQVRRVQNEPALRNALEAEGFSFALHRQDGPSFGDRLDLLDDEAETQNRARGEPFVCTDCQEIQPSPCCPGCGQTLSESVSLAEAREQLDRDQRRRQVGHLKVGLTVDRSTQTEAPSPPTFSPLGQKRTRSKRTAGSGQSR